jgi:hypothetical protein
MTIEWRPSGPPRRRGRGQTTHRDIIAELRLRPNVWAVVRRIAANVRGTADSSVTKLKDLGADAFTHSNGDEVEVWAMWPAPLAAPPDLPSRAQASTFEQSNPRSTNDER